MKKIIFLAHDPGGCDALLPVVERLHQETVPLEFYCIGPAANLNPDNAASEVEVIQIIQQMLMEKSVSVLVTGTSWGSKLELKEIAACKNKGIPTLSILDFWSNYQARFKDEAGNFIYPDYFLVMDKLAALEAANEGVPLEIIKVLGHPGLDKFISGQKHKRHLKHKKKILFLSQPLSVLYGKELGYTEQQVLEEVAQIIRENKDYSLYIKFHPKDSSSLKNNYLGLSVEGNLLDIMTEYDVIIGMNTMGLLHAVLLGLPAISYQPNLKKPDMCITNKLGLTRLVSSYQELKSILNTKRFSNENVKISQSESCIWLDGRSTDRVTRFIREVMLNEN